VGAVRYLQDQGAELLVIACNTATALALDEIKAAAGVKVIGVVEPGAIAAAAATRTRKVVVIGTDATIGSHAYRRALEARRVAVREKACPLFVPLVEEGWVEHPVTEQVARIYLSEAFSEVSSRGLPKVLSEVLPNDSGDFSADVLVLGCTHYPLIKPLLRRVAPEHVAIVDSAESTAVEVARQLGRELKIERIAASAGSEAIAVLSPSLRFFATDSAEKFRKMGTRFLGLPVEDVVHVDLKE
jgi:glutamate racemase